MSLCSDKVDCVVGNSITYIYRADVSELNETLVSLSFEESSELLNINESSFESFIKLEVVNLSNCLNLVILNQDVFYNCSCLTTVILPKDGSLSTIRGGCFAATAIKEITFPDSLKILGKHNGKNNMGAFTSSKIAKINYYNENNLEQIESYSLAQINLTEFELGPNVNYITGVAFEGPGKFFRRITQKGSNPNYYVFNDALYKDKTLVFYPPALELTTLKEGLEEISSEAFIKHQMIECTILPSSLRIVSGYVFHGCLNLRKIVFPSELTSIGVNSLERCVNLQFISLTSSIKAISFALFRYCTSLKTVVIQDGITSINNYSFAACPALCSLYIPDSVQSIADDAFLGSGVEKCGIICSQSVENLILKSTQLSEMSFTSCKRPSNCKLQRRENGLMRIHFFS